MITFYEERKRFSKVGTYRVRSVYLFGHVLIFRVYIQETSVIPMPGDK